MTLRIVGEIAHPVYKITLFQHGDRFTLQIDHGVISQQYRVRQSPSLESPDDILHMVDPAFLAEAADLFDRMYKSWQKSLQQAESQRKSSPEDWAPIL